MAKSKKQVVPIDEQAKQLGISKKQLMEQADKQVKKYFRKKGVLGPELKPKEKLQLEKDARAAREACEKNNPRRSDWPPFPLPDKYNNDDPHLIKAAIEAVGLIRRNYVPEAGCNGKWLKAASEVAFDVRSAWLYNQLVVLEVPLAENPRWPTEQNFARLEQWFVTLDAQVAREVDGSKATPTPTDNTGGDNIPPIKVKGKWRIPGGSFELLRKIDSNDTGDGIPGNKRLLSQLQRWLKSKPRYRDDLAKKLYFDSETNRIKSWLPHRSMFSEK